MKLNNFIGRCPGIFYVAAIFDLAGVILLLIGIFANLAIWDFLIYTGAIVIALSLIFWVLWYTFNVKVSFKEMELVL